jgi:hypothetical protein
VTVQVSMCNLMGLVSKGFSRRMFARGELLKLSESSLFCSLLCYLLATSLTLHSSRLFDSRRAGKAPSDFQRAPQLQALGTTMRSSTQSVSFVSSALSKSIEALCPGTPPHRS